MPTLPSSANGLVTHYLYLSHFTNDLRHSETRTVQTLKAAYQSDYSDSWIRKWQDFREKNGFQGQVWEVENSEEKPASLKWYLVGDGGGRVLRSQKTGTGGKVEGVEEGVRGMEI